MYADCSAVKKEVVEEDSNPMEFVVLSRRQIDMLRRHARELRSAGIRPEVAHAFNRRDADLRRNMTRSASLYNLAVGNPRVLLGVVRFLFSWKEIRSFALAAPLFRETLLRPEFSALLDWQVRLREHEGGTLRQAFTQIRDNFGDSSEVAGALEDIGHNLTGDRNTEVRWERILNAGGFNAVIACMRHHAVCGRVQAAGGAFLYNASATSTSCRQGAIKAGALAALCKAMQAHDEDVLVLQNACWGIWNIVAGSDDEQPSRSRAAAGSGAIEVVVSALVNARAMEGSSGQDVERYALGTLAVITATCGNIRQRTVSAGGLEAVVATIAAHGESSAIQQNGFHALWNIVAGADSRATERQTKLRQAGGEELAQAAIDRHPTATDVQHYAEGALAQMRRAL